MKPRKNIPKVLVITFAIIVAVVLLGAWKNFKDIGKQGGTNSTSLETKVIRSGNPSSKNWGEFIFVGCGEKLPGYKYALRIPENWTISKRDYGKESSYYDLEGNGESFTAGCTTFGVGGDVCEKKYWTNFKLKGEFVEACYGLQNGNWVLGVLNVPRDSNTQAAIAFWAEGIEKSMLEKIFSSFKTLGN